MSDFDHDFLNSVEIIGYSERERVRLANRGDENREAIRCQLSAILSPPSKRRIMALGSLGALWVAFDGHRIRNKKCGHLTFEQNGVLFVSCAMPAELDQLGEGRVLILNNQTSEILYHGSDGMD